MNPSWWCTHVSFAIQLLQSMAFVNCALAQTPPLPLHWRLHRPAWHTRILCALCSSQYSNAKTCCSITHPPSGNISHCVTHLSLTPAAKVFEITVSRRKVASWFFWIFCHLCKSEMEETTLMQNWLCKHLTLKSLNDTGVMHLFKYCNINNCYMNKQLILQTQWTVTKFWYDLLFRDISMLTVLCCIISLHIHIVGHIVHVHKYAAKCNTMVQLSIWVNT